MPKDFFADLPPELLSLLLPALSNGSLNALLQTCRRLREGLQPALEWRITPLLGKELLLWAAGEAKPHILAKLLAPPHRIDACTTNFSDESALHMAVSAGSIECAALLLAHGADPMHSLAGEQPLHRAAQGNHLALAALLLDHGAPINDVKALIGSTRALPLHLACRHGHTDMVRLLLARGAHLEARGSDGTALGFAVRARRVDVVRLLLEQGAHPEVTAVDWPPRMLEPTLLYLALGLEHPPASPGSDVPPPSEEGRKELMAMLMAYGASKARAWATVSAFSTPLARKMGATEEEVSAEVRKRFKEAEALVPDFCNEKLWSRWARLGKRRMLSISGLRGRFRKVPL